MGAISYHMLDAKERRSQVFRGVNLSFPLILNFLPYLTVICKTCPSKYVMVNFLFCNHSFKTPYKSNLLYFQFFCMCQQNSLVIKPLWMNSGDNWIFCMMYNFKNKLIQ